MAIGSNFLGRAENITNVIWNENEAADFIFGLKT